MPDFGLDTLPLAITSPGRRWPGPGPEDMAPSGLVPGAPPHIRDLTDAGTYGYRFTTVCGQTWAQHVAEGLG